MGDLNEQIELAKQLAMRAHMGQKRWNGDPYVTHPERVANAMSMPPGKIVGWLHDVVEDTDVTLAEVRLAFGDEIAGAVDSVTRRENESYLDFILRAKKNLYGAGVKIADIEDNLRDLTGYDLSQDKKRRELRDKYLLALHIMTEDSRRQRWLVKAP